MGGGAGTGATGVTSLTPLPPASATVATVDVGSGKDGVLKQAREDAGKLRLENRPLAAAAPPAAMRKSEFFNADDVKKESLGNVQRFARLDIETKAKARLSDKVAPVKTVLASFEVEQVGREVRVVDGDGSVYTGYVQSAADASRSRSVVAENVARPAGTLRSIGATVEHNASALANAEVQTGQSYFFRVIGTNRTLNDNVVFTGQLIAGADLKALPEITNGVRLSGGARGIQPEPAKKTGASPGNPSRISGKAVVGNRGEVQIDAVSAGK